MFGVAGQLKEETSKKFRNLHAFVSKTVIKNVENAVGNIEKTVNVGLEAIMSERDIQVQRFREI